MKDITSSVDTPRQQWHGFISSFLSRTILLQLLNCVGFLLPYSFQSPPFIMISGDVHGPVTDMGNYNSGVIAGTVTIGTLVQSNKSE